MSGDLAIAEVDFETGWAAVAPLITEQNEHDRCFSHVQDVAPDYHTYRRIEDEGRLVILLARVDGRLIGYGIVIASKSIHHEGLKIYQVDACYVRAGDQGHGHAFFSLRAALKRLCAQRFGAGTLIWQARPNSALDAVLEGLGCKLLDTRRMEAI